MQSLKQVRKAVTFADLSPKSKERTASGDISWPLMTLFDADPFNFEEQPPLGEPPPDQASMPQTRGEVTSTTPSSTMPRREVFTDGACKGNPGPGGWGWTTTDGVWASGSEDPSTNQRMEVQAVLHAVQNLDGPIEIVSDSTYVVNCFKDGWWRGWEKRGWKNSQKKPVANQDLWKPLVELVKSKDVTFRWVKGHAGNEWNDRADEIAVAASIGEGSNGQIIGSAES